MNYRVLDISAYQGEVDFAKGKSDGIWGVMLKATEGERYLSPAFDKKTIRRPPTAGCMSAPTIICAPPPRRRPSRRRSFSCKRLPAKS